MQIFNLALAVSNIFWIILAIFVVLILGVAIYTFIKDRRFHLDFSNTLIDMSEDIKELDRYSIDNLDDVVNILDKDSDYPLISTAGYKLKTDSEKLYQGQWISNPDELLSPKRLLNQNQYQTYSYEVPVYLLTTGVLVSMVLLLIGVNHSGERSFIAIALIPLLLALLAAAILAVQTKRNSEALNRNINYLSECIKDRVPVFRELAGTAALIEAFFKYDRSMSKSVKELSDNIVALNTKDLAKKLGENISEVMNKEVNPALLKAVDKLNTSAESLAQERQSGLSKLADEYSEAVTTSLEKKLQPFYQELENLTINIYEANKASEMSLQAMKDYQANSQDLQKKLNGTLDSLKTANKEWNKNLEKISSSTESLANTNNNLASTQKENLEFLSQSLDALNTNIDAINKNLSQDINSLSEHLKKFSSEYKEVSDAYLDTITKYDQNQSKLLDHTEDLNMLFADQVEALNKQSLDISKDVASIDENLNYSVQNFNSALSSSVVEVLDNFDKSLAEISDRLINTTAEINDTINNLSSAIRNEALYNSKRAKARENRDRARRANRPKDSADDNVLDFLLSNDQQENEEVDDE